MLVGRLMWPKMKDVFGDLLPACIAAGKSPNPLREVGRLIVAHPERRGVLLAYLAVLIAKHKRDCRVALHLIRQAQRQLTDDYQGLLYASACGVGVFLCT